MFFNAYYISLLVKTRINDAYLEFVLQLLFFSQAAERRKKTIIFLA